jgi:hypothetical protein
MLKKNEKDRILSNFTETGEIRSAGTTGEVKLLTPLTMENIAGSVIAAGLASEEETKQLVAELYQYAQTAGTIASAPRIIEAWARRPTPG